MHSQNIKLQIKKKKHLFEKNLTLLLISVEFKLQPALIAFLFKSYFLNFNNSLRKKRNLISFYD